MERRWFAGMGPAPISPRRSRRLLERPRGAVVAQAEEVADGVEDRMGLVVVGLVQGGADGGAGVVEELVLEPRGHVGDRLAVGLGEARAGGEEGGQLALADLVGVAADLL